MSACWNDDGNFIQQAHGWKKDIKKSLEEVTAKLNDLEEHPIGSLQKMGFRQYHRLSQHRKKLAAQMDMLEATFPPNDRLVKGPNNMTFLKEGVIAVKRPQGKREEFVWVGTFCMKKLWQENEKL